ncbi:class I SAM-dependent methyltransferase [Arthrobacter agilis]|uniref:class I SAM-dependent methyltransferase n=1 Tax=Arthrobacter agilis TaxID=37921 RepID=UPI00278A3A8A|nr:class I SAM-dependent methyltransferase [Arthrobacter agilis]MDQ0736631.1 SAM-dependent methyltransferase [Arthrobacter agilis]
MLNIVDQLRMVPEVARLAQRTPRDPVTAWEGYWSRIGTTGTQGEVLWDAEIGLEADQYAQAIDRFMDRGLPIIDGGCGNGRWTRWLAGRFPSALGVDVADSAVRRAAHESQELPSVAFRTADLTAPGAGLLLHEEHGDANVFVRGVFHVLRPPQRKELGRNLRDIVGDRGRVLLTETNFRGNPLSYLQSLGARPGNIPAPLRRAIGGIPVPGHFGPAERRAAFPDGSWTVLADGPVTIEAVPMSGRTSTSIPGYLAMLGAR